ncbi:unnamed protein product, partial [Amoebophrya sp. A25]|eukprot:GSA25T00026671001.1
MSLPQLSLDLVVTFCTRCVDWYRNEKVVRSAVCSTLWNSTLKRRLGSVFLFPYVQPENCNFKLDLRYHEDRLCLFSLLQYEKIEDGDNIPSDSIHFDNPDNLVWNGYLPKTWENEAPRRG